VGAVQALDRQAAREVHQLPAGEARVGFAKGRQGAVADRQQHDAATGENLLGRLRHPAVPADAGLRFELEVAGQVGGHAPAADEAVGGSAVHTVPVLPIKSVLSLVRGCSPSPSTRIGAHPFTP
jgi:hypothetical protein